MVDFQTFLQDVFMSEGLDLGKESQYLAYILCLKTEILFSIQVSSKFSCCGSSPVCNHCHNFTDMVDFLLRAESDEHESLGHRTLRSSFSHIQGHIHEVCIMSIFTVTHVVFSCTDKTCSLFIIAKDVLLMTNSS